MSELINKYTEHYDKLIDLLIRFHSLNMEFMDRQSPQRTRRLRIVLKEMRQVIYQMEQISQARMKERRIEYGEAHPLRLRKGKNNE